MLAVQPPGALQEPSRVDQVGSPDLVHVHPQARKAPHQGPGSARMVEVHVGQKQRPRLALEAGQQALQARRGPWVDDHAIELVSADHAITAEVHQVDQLSHLRGSGDGGRGQRSGAAHPNAGGSPPTVRS